MRVLVVEDEPSLAGQLAAALGGLGYAVVTAADGARADFLARTEQYDAVVLDLGLPKVDGLTLRRRWRHSALALPVLVLTRPRQLAREGPGHRQRRRRRRHQAVPDRRSPGAAAGADPALERTGRAGTSMRGRRPRTSRVTLRGAPVKLTSHEFRVLSYLMHHRERAVPQGELSGHVYAGDGAGLPEVLRETVLQGGVRADEAAPGSGFGLAIVRDLAEVYGGRITLDRSALGGLRARLHLPQAD